MFIINIHITEWGKILAQDITHDFTSTSSLEVLLFNYLCLPKYCRHVLITGWIQRDKWSFPLWKNGWRPSRVRATKALQSLFQTSGSSLGTVPLRYCRKLCLQRGFFYIIHFLSHCNKISYSLFIALQAETEVSVAGRKLKELFEEHLRIIFPDQTFPEIKQEIIPTSPPDSISWYSSPQSVSTLIQTARTHQAFPAEMRQQ